MGGRSIPIVFGLEGAAVFVAAGLLLCLLGWRQQRAERDPRRIPWISPKLKTVAGLFLALYGAFNALVVFLASLTR